MTLKNILLLNAILYLCQGELVMKVWLLNNGGQILSTFTDYITLEISTHSMSKIVVCGEYHYQPGDQIKFTNFYVPIEDGQYLTITLKQRNFFTADDAISLMTYINRNNLGYYLGQLTLDQFKAGVTLGFNYEGLFAQINPYQYTVQADYYILFEII